VPDGYRLYRGSAFVAAVPEGWKEDGSGDDVSFTDPAEGVKRAVSIQRVASFSPGDPGDALADAAGKMKDDPEYPQYGQESFRRGIPYLGGSAAELQFTFVKGDAPDGRGCGCSNSTVPSTRSSWSATRSTGMPESRSTRPSSARCGAPPDGGPARAAG